MSEVLDGTDETLAADSSAAGGAPQPEPGPEAGSERGRGDFTASARRWLRSHAIGLAGIPAAAITLFLLYLHQARNGALNADGSSNALQAWDMLHGNLLLSHWTLSDVSFYLTELPEYMLVEAVHGLNGDVVHFAAALTYTLAVLLAAWLARGRSRGLEAFARVLIVVVVMIAPQPGIGTVVTLSSPDHFGTSVPLLVIFLAFDRLPRRWYTPPLLFLLLVWAEASDSTAIFVGGVGLALFTGMRLWRREGDRRYEAKLFAAAVLSIVAATGLPQVIHRLGGFTVHPPNMTFNTADQMNAGVWRGVGFYLQLFAADFLGMPLSAPAADGANGKIETAATLLHVVGAALVFWALVTTARRLKGDGDQVAKLITVGVLLNLTAFLLSTEITGGTREIAAILPLGAALAGRVLGPRLTDRRTIAGLAALGVVFCGVLLDHATYRSLPANSRGAELWLKGHGYTYGLGAYWSSNNITVDSGGTVQVRAVDSGPTGIQQYDWETKSSWYDPAKYYANFLVMDTGSPGLAQYASPEQAVKQWGRPAQTVTIGTQVIMIWNKNLLETLPPTWGQ